MLKGVGTKIPPFSFFRKMVTILGIYLYLEGTFYQKDLYIQKGETFLKITYCQDIRAISVNVKRYILKESVVRCNLELRRNDIKIGGLKNWFFYVDFITTMNGYFLLSIILLFKM